jgi:hypothetical protein
MKTPMVILLTCVTISVTSQIKVFSGGTQSYGSTTAPAYGEKHHFAGDLVVSEAGNTAGSCALIRANGTVTNFSSASRPDYSWLGDSGTGLFQAAYNNLGFTTGASERMRLTGNGNLLLGTTSEFGSRFVSYIANSCAIMAITTHSADNAYCQANYVNRNNAKAFSVLNNTSGSYVETYTVKGSGDVWAKTTTNWSDRNLKENIDTLQNSLGKLKQLKGVKYNFKSSFVGSGPLKAELGLIAQDVELVFPEAVNTNENGLKGIMYHSLIPVLIESIKELDRKNAQLQNDIAKCCSKASDGKTNRSTRPSDDNTTTDEAKSYLKQNKPNPFNKETLIDYNIIESGSAAILIFDMTGKLLKTIPVNIPGKGSIIINASDFQPGMYHYSLVVNDTEIDTKRMILTN